MFQFLMMCFIESPSGCWKVNLQASPFKASHEIERTMVGRKKVELSFLPHPSLLAARATLSRLKRTCLQATEKFDSVPGFYV